MVYGKMKDTMLHAVDEIAKVYAELGEEPKRQRETDSLMPGVAYMDSATGLLPIDGSGINMVVDELAHLKELQDATSDISDRSKDRLDTVLTECRELQNELIPDLGSALDSLESYAPEGRLAMQTVL